MSNVVNGKVELVSEDLLNAARSFAFVAGSEVGGIMPDKLITNKAEAIDFLTSVGIVGERLRLLRESAKNGQMIKIPFCASGEPWKEGQISQVAHIDPICLIREM